MPECELQDSMDPSSDGPERLRAVSEFSEDLGPALPPMDDMLPRMTPKKKGDGNSEVPSPHVSRDDSVNRGSLARTSFGNVDQDEMLPADLEMENMDLPPMLPPADEEVGGGANVPDSQAHRNEEEVAAMDEDPPAPPPDDFPAAPPEDFPEAPPEDFPGAPPEDFPMEEPPVNPGATFVTRVQEYELLCCYIVVPCVRCALALVMTAASPVRRSCFD